MRAGLENALHARPEIGTAEAEKNFFDVKDYGRKPEFKRSILHLQHFG
jgi:hypothetical protein